MALTQPGRQKNVIIAALLFISESDIHRVLADKFCGVDADDAKSTCWQPCTSDGDCCAISLRCYETGSSCGSSALSGTNHFFCGTSWCDAAYKCGTPCPNQTECPDGEWCFADIPCDSDSPVSAPPLPAPPTASPYQFCGSSSADAKSDCWQPCPRGESDCCLGLKCFDTSQNFQEGGTCSNSDYSGSNHFFCGTSWCNAAYTCQNACPGGSSEECPSGQYCYADVPCEGTQSPPPPDVEAPPNIFSQYCGTSQEDAADNCWQPCRDDSDCCFDQTCYSGVTACAYPDNIGADHFFCGSDYCEASFSCTQPCPSGFDAECPSGQRCVANTPCNANVRSTTANFLMYGLPKSSFFIRQISLDGGEGQMNAASGHAPSFPIGLIFGICLACFVGLNIWWSRTTGS